MVAGVGGKGAAEHLPLFQVWEETEKSAVSDSPWDPEQERLEAASFTRGKLAAHSWDPTHERA